MTKAKTLRRLLLEPQLSFLLEVHNGISAKIAEEAGFRGLWGSGLAIAAAAGVRDNNELSWTQVLEIIEYVCDASSVPLLLDGDTGYGNFNNMRRLVRKLESRHVAGVCIEDKLFPKTNSFIDGKTQPLADPHEFAGKIKAGKDAQSDDDFSVIARVEALIAGWGLDEALRRADLYHQAGADGILIHSGKSTAKEVLAFQKEWAQRSPVLIVPTTYATTPTAVLENAGFSVVIWANHMLRSAVRAQQATAQAIQRDGCLHNVEGQIAPIHEIFRLQNADELKQAERHYLPKRPALLHPAVSPRTTRQSINPGVGNTTRPLAVRPPSNKAPSTHQPPPLAPTLFVESLAQRGFALWTGVPCSILAPILNQVHAHPNIRYLSAASEGEAVGIAAGATLANVGSVVMCQNSGLGNAVNPLTSLNHTFRLPTLLIVTHRGEPGTTDAPQHRVMGRITTQLLDLLGIPWAPFPTSRVATPQAIIQACNTMAHTQLPYAFVMSKNAVAPSGTPDTPRRLKHPVRQPQESFAATSPTMSRLQAITTVRKVIGDHGLLVATTGRVGRELFSLGHQPNQLYMVGSMGCAPALGLGLHTGLQLGATKRTRTPVVVLDGDGACLMKMGTLATIGHTAPVGLVHVLLDNGVHDSTGGQATASSTVDFAAVAAACGYRHSLRADQPETLANMIGRVPKNAGPTFIHVRVKPGTIPNLGRPTVWPEQIKQGLMQWIAQQAHRAA